MNLRRQVFWTKFLEARRLNLGKGMQGNAGIGSGADTASSSSAGIDFTGGGGTGGSKGKEAHQAKSLKGVRQGLDLTAMETRELLMNRPGGSKAENNVLWLVNRQQVASLESPTPFRCACKCFLPVVKVSWIIPTGRE